MTAENPKEIIEKIKQIYVIQKRKYTVYFLFLLRLDYKTQNLL